MHHFSKAADAALITGLLTSPAWAALLANVNLLLTSATLVVGLVLGLLRLRRELTKPDGGDDA
ncbi:hypothetical protein VPG91_06145 [Nitrospirillum amazonense]|uniref:hypothetical protein n=1 Tax=Nitrospirillum amazonense TaxID=28077 RepID=UPI002DD43BF0|nr:hypothetical protein [Nitrospirillum amazonense]MEC4590560.1 hypothetical protein [Nitrospirillum amazonense]